MAVYWAFCNKNLGGLVICFRHQQCNMVCDRSPIEWRWQNSGGSKRFSHHTTITQMLPADNRVSVFGYMSIAAWKSYHFIIHNTFYILQDNRIHSVVSQRIIHMYTSLLLGSNALMVTYTFTYWIFIVKGHIPELVRVYFVVATEIVSISIYIAHKTVVITIASGFTSL